MIAAFVRPTILITAVVRKTNLASILMKGVRYGLVKVDVSINLSIVVTITMIKDKYLLEENAI